jgi:tetratricopeptide (TPR) repeat protein
MNADAAAWIAAGNEALRLGRPRQLLRAFERAIDAGGDDEESIRITRMRALEIMASATRVGWFHEAIAAFEALIELTNGAPAVHLAAARVYESLRENALAIEHARHSPSLDAHLIRARAGARDAIAQAEALAPRERLHEVAHAALGIGLFDDAERIFAAVGDDAARAELALWRGDPDRAETLARSEVARCALRVGGASAKDDNEPATRNAQPLFGANAHAVLGGIRVMRGAYDDALPHLDRALAMRNEDSTARHWRAEALRRMERLDEAVEEIDLAIAHAPRYLITGQATRLLCSLAMHRDEERQLPADAYAELVEGLAPLAGEPSAAVRSGLGAAVEAFLESAIAALAGNRSHLPTCIENGALVAIPVRLNSRMAARYHQESIRAHPVETVLAGFDALITEYGELPTIHCHRGELQLWLGAWNGAQRSFARALEIDRSTRWAWIGLGASHIGAGALDAAARAYDDAVIYAPPPGRTIHVYRGELSFLRGDRDAAARDLERALYMNPERLSAQLLLARVDHARGNRDACRTRVARAREAAPALFHDLAGEPDDVARTVLQMMRGNRSSNFVTYFTADGRMRFVPPPRIDAVRLK